MLFCGTSPPLSFDSRLLRILAGSEADPGCWANAVLFFGSSPDPWDDEGGVRLLLFFVRSSG